MRRTLTRQPLHLNIVVGAGLPLVEILSNHLVDSGVYEPVVLRVKARADARPPFGRLAALTGPRARFVGFGMRSAASADRRQRLGGISQVRLLASKGLRRTISLCRQATSATFAGFPRLVSWLWWAAITPVV